MMGRTLISLVLVLVLTTGVASEEMGFKARVDKVQLAFEDVIELTLEVTVDSPGVRTKPLPPPEMVSFRMGGSGSSVERQGEQVLRRYTYTLIPARSGEVTIPAFQVEFATAEGSDTLSSEPITVTIEQPRPSRSGGSDLLFLYVGIGAVLVVAGVGFVYSRRRKSEIPGVAPDWKDVAAAEFAGIMKLADREDFRQFSSQVSKFVITLLENKHEAKLSGYTFADVQRWMEERGLDGELRGTVKELFAFCEEVKFGTGKVDVQKGRAAAARAQKIVELLVK